MKSIKLISITFILLTLTLTSVKAQFLIKKKDLNNDVLKEKTIFFEMKDLSEKQIKHLKDEKVLEDFKIQYQKENTILAKTLEDHWVSEEKINGLSTKEIKSRIENKQETWYISLYKHTDKFFDKKVHKRNYYYYYQHYTLSLFKNKQKVLSIPLVNNYISELDIHFAVNMMQNIAYNIDEKGKLNQYTKAINQKTSQIKQKTLLVPKSYINYSEEYIKQFYEGDIKIVKEQEIIDAMHSNDPNYAYLLININHLSDKPSFNHFIFDCATDNPVFLIRQSNSYTKTGIQKRDQPILKREIQFLLVSHFKKYNSKI